MFKEILTSLEKGSIRCAYQDKDENWVVNKQAKEAILEAFKEGKLSQMGPFVDKDTIPTQSFSIERKIRFVPGGSSVRIAAYIAPAVIIMPPSYINIGAYIDEGTMVDSHVLVGSCAQIGKRVHLSAGVQIGGVLEPVGANPVIIEDDVFVGADAIIVEGMLIKKGAVIAPGVVLSKGTQVFDLINNRVLEKLEAIPENAVVVSGTRPVTSRWGKDLGLSQYCALIIKYRDAKTNSSLVLESLLR